MGFWEERAAAAAERKSRMMSFGPNAWALLVRAEHGLFAVDPEDGSVALHLLQEGCYAEYELELASSVVSPGGNVLIVGTHIGALTVPLSRRCQHLDAIEANPATLDLIEVNLRLNGCSNVTLHKMAASDKHEKIEFLMNRDNSGGSKRRPSHDHLHYVYDNPDIILVEAQPLDEVLGDQEYDLVLMDIEGSEYFALKGMQSVLSRAKALCVEFFRHHLIDVGGVELPEFAAQILPHFSWMFIPETRRLVARDDMGSVLQDMFDRGESSHGIYFMKEVTEAWLISRGIGAVPA